MAKYCRIDSIGKRDLRNRSIRWMKNIYWWSDRLSCWLENCISSAWLNNGKYLTLISWHSPRLTLSIQSIHSICRMDNFYWRSNNLLSIGKIHLISCKLAIKPVGLIDSLNGYDPKPGCCWSENRISLLTTDPGGPKLSIRPIRSSHRMDTTQNMAVYRLENRISLVTTYPAVNSFTGYYNESTVKEYINTWIFLVLKTPVKEVKHLNITRSKNTKVVGR